MCNEAATDLVGAQMRLQDTLERVWKVAGDERCGLWAGMALRLVVMDALGVADPAEVPAAIERVFV